tara:strand:- start:93 stop:590 length:498 start_codon:yes stop_codon:yes gene_type:complete
MPDLIVHSVAGYLLIPLRWRSKVLLSAFLLGCIFPDLVRGPLLILSNLSVMLDIQPFRVSDLPSIQILHSPIPLLIQAWLFSFMFKKGLRLKIFLNFFSGIALHLLLDAGQRAYHLSYFWLFPFSFDNPVRGIWWSDDSLWLTLSFGFMGALVFTYRYLAQMRSR